MFQNGQTEPTGVTRSCTMVQREVKFVHSKKAINQRKISHCEIFLRYVTKIRAIISLNIYNLLPFCDLGHFNIPFVILLLFFQA